MTSPRPGLNQRNIVVIGATGFLGSAVSDALEHRGARVIRWGRDAIARADSAFSRSLASSSEVIWLAGIASPAQAARHPELAAQDVETFRAVLGQRQDTWPEPRVTLVSSGGTVYDPVHAPPYAESSATNGIGVYGRSRLELEHELDRVRHIGDCVVRLSNVYGPGQRLGNKQGVVAHWVSAVRSQQPLPLSSSLRTRRDFVFIDDVARAFVALAELERRPAVMNVGSGRPASLGELAAIVGSLTGGVHFDVDPDSLPIGAPAAVWLDVALADRLLDWRPLVELSDGIAITLAAIPFQAS